MAGTRDEQARLLDLLRDPHRDWDRARAECPVQDVSLLGRPGKRVLRFDAAD